MSRSAEYSVWCNMIRRCFTPTNNQYRNYGGRGIRVCDRWRTSFAHFFADVGRRPEGLSGQGLRPRFSLDRINNDGHYEPGNVRWATQSQQTLNSRQSRAHREAP